MARKNKFGSPYDPQYGGKQMRPQDKKEQEKREEERRQHQLRGCGDPNCPMCNPETAAMGGARSGRMSGGPFGGRGGRPSVMGFPMDEIMMEILSNKERFISGTFAEESGDQPPASYRAARKEVEEFICVAPETAFDDIVGNEEPLGHLKDAIQAPVKHKELYAAYDMKMPKGALLSGPPGCGKTMFAKAAAAEMKRLYGTASEFLSLSGSELQSMYVGETEARIVAIFTYAREYQKYHGHPLLVFIDEADVMLPDRTGRVRRVAPWEESQVSTFLAELDGMKENGAFLLLASNRPEVIDQAVLRDGRCDFKITVKRPTKDGIEIILRNNFKGIYHEEKTSVDDLVFTAIETFCDPHKILIEAHAIGFDGKEFKDMKAKAFCFEHIISGAMAASVPARAKRYAFNRDKVTGVPTGVTAADVMKAVNALFEENRGLEHEYALDEFKQEFYDEVQADRRRNMN
jgi:SpoVK/Ycf46/Vps4 family AAA+-type ATPase